MRNDIMEKFMKVKAYCVNKNTPSQFYLLIDTKENRVLSYAPNNWKTESGALRWAKNHGYIVPTKKPIKKKTDR